MVVEWYLRVENAKIKPKNNIKVKQKSPMPNLLKKCQNAKPKFSRPNALRKDQI